MLKQRVITALVIAPIALALVFLAPDWLFTLAMLGIALVGAWEWSALAGKPATSARYAMVALFAACALMGWYLERSLPQALLMYCLLALAWWIFSLAWIAVWLTLLPSLAAVVAVHAVSHWYLLILLLLTTSADIGAYFAGRAFGRRKLAPLVSPGKTWEGVVGGVAGAAVVAAVASRWLPVPAWLFILICVGVALLSVVGDLSESQFKRLAGLKDSGGFFPGHGGVLDRVDSLTAAAPLYWLGMYLLGLLT